MKAIIFMLCILLYSFSTASADSFTLTNGDRISGTITGEDAITVTIESPLLGTVTIDKDHVTHRIGEPEQKPAADEKRPEWTRTIEAGYNASRGNTATSELFGSFNIHRKAYKNELTFKGNIYEGSSEKKMNAQRWYTMGRFAFSFWKRKWYNFYTYEADHDKFAFVDYRLIPSTGIGYWFSDKDPFKAMIECAIGWEHTTYNNDAEDTDEAILLPRAMVEYTFLERAHLSEELTLFPSLTNSGKYRALSETAFSFDITDALATKLSWINEYNSDPSGDAKKHDMRILSSLAYSF